MLNVTGSRIYQNLWGKETEPLTEKVVHQLGHLEVKVDLNPIGGYRGKVGTLTIHHIDHKVFTDWSEDDLQNLAKLERMILHIGEQAQVSNYLIFGRQEADKEFKLSLVAYPRCNWIEKIQGFIHVIFGAPSLKEKEAEEIAAFYRDQFQEDSDIPSFEGEHREGKADAFCRSSVIEGQKIADLSLDDQNYYLLHDKWPKGRSTQDPHFLIVPEGDSGHCDGSKFSEEKRMHMLKIAQKTMQILLQEGYSTLLFLERNGEKLQGVQHKHCHTIGIQSFPQTFFQKVKAMVHQLYTPALSDLQGRIRHYQQYDWNLKEVKI